MPPPGRQSGHLIQQLNQNLPDTRLAGGNAWQNQAGAVHVQAMTDLIQSGRVFEVLLIGGHNMRKPLKVVQRLQQFHRL